MISTPINPTAVASQRRTPTVSPRKTIDSAVTNSGATKPVAEASAIGRNRKPEMKNSEDPSSATPRIACNPGRCERKAYSGEPGTIAGDMINAKTRNRIHAISIDGSVADRYFAVTSEAPRNTVEARISAMRSEEHTSELQSPCNLVCRLLLEKKKKRQDKNWLHTTRMK